MYPIITDIRLWFSVWLTIIKWLGNTQNIQIKKTVFKGDNFYMKPPDTDNATSQGIYNVMSTQKLYICTINHWLIGYLLDDYAVSAMKDASNDYIWVARLNRRLLISTRTDYITVAHLDPRLLTGHCKDHIIIAHMIPGILIRSVGCSLSVEQLYPRLLIWFVLYPLSRGGGAVD